MFVDASAIVAILTREPDGDALADALDDARSPITSPIAIFEAGLAICRKRHASVAEAQDDVLAFLGTAGVRTVSITGADAEIALHAFARYGKGRGIRRSSIWETASPMPLPKTTERRCCSRGTISTRPTSARPRNRAARRPRHAAQMAPRHAARRT